MTNDRDDEPSDEAIIFGLAIFQCDADDGLTAKIGSWCEGQGAGGIGASIVDRRVGNQIRIAGDGRDGQLRACPRADARQINRLQIGIFKQLEIGQGIQRGQIEDAICRRTYCRLVMNFV